MKKIIVLFLFISAFSYAQYAIKGTMSPIENSSWVLLYKIEEKKEKQGFLNFHYQLMQKLAHTE